MRKALKHVSITSSVVTLIVPATISVSILSDSLVWVAAVLKGGKVVMGREVVVMSEGTMVGKMVMGSTCSTCFVFSVDVSSSVTSDLGNSIDGATAVVRLLVVVVISADVVVVVVLLVVVVVTVVGAT